MARKTYNTEQRAEAKQRRQDKIADLRAILANVETSPNRFGIERMAADTHPGYSLKNQLLIMHQRPDATRTAGFRQWKQLGRSVNKGAKGIAILVPMTVGSEEKGDTRVIFTTGYVFDVSDTRESGEQEIDPEAAAA